MQNVQNSRSTRKKNTDALQVITQVQEQNKDIAMSEDELLAFVNEVVHEVRAQAKAGIP